MKEHVDRKKNLLLYKDNHVGSNTMAVLPVWDVYYNALIKDRIKGDIYVKETPLEVIQKGCLGGYATYEGRKKAVQILLGYTQKPPIPVVPFLNIFAFPTASPTQFDCIWLFPTHIYETAVHKGHIQVIFKNGETVNVPISVHTYSKQMERTSHCMTQFGPNSHDY